MKYYNDFFNRFIEETINGMFIDYNKCTFILKVKFIGIEFEIPIISCDNPDLIHPAYNLFPNIKIIQPSFINLKDHYCLSRGSILQKLLVLVCMNDKLKFDGIDYVIDTIYEYKKNFESFYNENKIVEWNFFYFNYMDKKIVVFSKCLEDAITCLFHKFHICKSELYGSIEKIFSQFFLIQIMNQVIDDPLNIDIFEIFVNFIQSNISAYWFDSRFRVNYI